MKCLGLKELNEFNTHIYINNKKYKYKTNHKFRKKGEYIIKLKIKALLKDCNFMFSGCKNIIDLDLSSFDTKNVINMEYMFLGCSN